MKKENYPFIKLSGSYDGCGFTVTHSEGIIKFEQEITGISNEGLIIDGIYVSAPLSFPVECSFPDQG